MSRLRQRGHACDSAGAQFPSPLPPALRGERVANRVSAQPSTRHRSLRLREVWPRATIDLRCHQAGYEDSMRVALLLAVAVTFLAATKAGAAEPDAVQAQAKADLQRYYASDGRRNEPEPWRAPLKQLGSADAAERSRAVAYLVALLSQALDDEKSG